MEKEIEYRGFFIKPKTDFGNTENEGYIVVQNGVNVLAGATWGKSISDAKMMVDCHIEANGDADRFWQLVRNKHNNEK
jgi:hypothetical protein